MTDGKKPRAKKLVKTIRVSEDTHAKFQAFQFDGHYVSADVAMESLLRESAPAKCVFHAGEVREALEELAEIKRTLLAANISLGAHSAGPIQHGDEGE